LQAFAVVVDLEQQVVPQPADRDGDFAGAVLYAADAVPQRIFDEGLQHEEGTGSFRGIHAGSHCDRPRERAVEPQFFEFEVGPYVVEFFLNGAGDALVLAQPVDEVFSEFSKHVPGLFHLAFHQQVLDACEHVEEEVRVHLGPQVAAAEGALALEKFFVAVQLGETPFEQLLFGEVTGFRADGTGFQHADAAGKTDHRQDGYPRIQRQPNRTEHVPPGRRRPQHR